MAPSPPPLAPLLASLAGLGDKLGGPALERCSRVTKSVTKLTGNTYRQLRCSMSNSTLRRFVFTLNNYTDEEVLKCEKFVNDFSKYGIFGKELAPTTNTPHLQGFINLHKPMRLNTIKKHIANRVHIEKANGSDEQNQNYCRKAGDFFEKGAPVVQGQRNDLASLIQTIDSGERQLTVIAEKHPCSYIRYHRGISEYLRIRYPIPPRDFKTCVFYYWGNPGTGKSRRSLDEARKEDANSIYYKPRGLWWDGYKQQTNVIIDDFYGWIKYDEMLKIMDRYPYKVQIKGGFEEFTSKNIWITSNIDTDLLYKFPGYNDVAFNRRLTKKEYM